MEPYAIVDSNNFPVINVFFTGNNASEENFPLYLEQVKQVYAQEKKVAIIFDASKAVLPGVAFQKMQAIWLKDNKELMVNFCVGTAYIIPSLIIRNVLKAIFTFQKQPVDYIVCKTKREAQDWVNNKLVH